MWFKDIMLPLDLSIDIEVYIWNLFCVCPIASIRGFSLERDGAMGELYALFDQELNREERNKDRNIREIQWKQCFV